MSTAEMLMEADFRDAVTPVTSAFVPSMVFMLPMLCAMPLPNVAVCRVMFRFVRLVPASRPVGWLVMSLRPLSAALVFPPLVRAPFALLWSIRLVSVGVLCRCASVFVLVVAALHLLGAILPPVLVTVLRVGEGSCSQNQAQN